MKSRLWLLIGLGLTGLMAAVLWLAWDRPAFFAGLLGALFGSAASLGGSALAQRYARERDHEMYARGQGMARADRLRDRYIALVRAAQALEEAGTELNVLWAGDTVETRDARVAENLRRVLDDLDAVVAAVRLEPGTRDVLNEWRESLRSYVWLKHIVETNRAVPQTFKTFKTQDLINALNELKQHASNLADLAITHLERLEAAK